MSFMKEEFDQLFETYLKPLNSRNARLLFKILYDHRLQYLTTLDLQYSLKKYDQQLNKIELNNWLTTLMISGLVEKSENRGKPTTIIYSNRYTYDLWKITQKGEEIGELIPLLLYTVYSDHDYDKKNHFKDYKIKSLKLISYEKIRKFLKNNEGEVSLLSFENILKISRKDLIEHLKNLRMLNEEFVISVIPINDNLFNKILRILGLSRKSGFKLTLRTQ